MRSHNRKTRNVLTFYSQFNAGKFRVKFSTNFRTQFYSSHRPRIYCTVRDFLCLWNWLPIHFNVPWKLYTKVCIVDMLEMKKSFGKCELTWYGCFAVDTRVALRTDTDVVTGRVSDDVTNSSELTCLVVTQIYSQQENPSFLAQPFAVRRLKFQPELRPFSLQAVIGSQIIYMHTIHNVIIFIDTSTMLDKTKLIL